jgi:type III secretion protein V
LLASNIAVSVLILLTAMYIPDRLSFAAMPTVLLVTTIYRLALAVCATRLILLSADAGRVIGAFGEFVVGGNFAVGAVVFLILTIVQYLVVARGAERVAEVGARFSLDAMPGRQMAIDADLRAGAWTAAQAQHGRRALQRESQFYGAMDGAMKFVKGDAIAGMVITAINIVAGVGIGIGMRGMGAVESLRSFGLLSVGNGIVMQICSLLVSTASGVMVTRVASEQGQSSLAGDIGSQMFGDPRLVGAGALFVLGLAVVPGLPAAPFVIIAALGGALAWGLAHSRVRHAAQREASVGQDAWSSAAWPVSIELGEALASEFLDDREGALAIGRALDQARARLFLELGVELPVAQVRSCEQIDPHAYRLSLQAIPAGEAVIAQGKALALTSAETLLSMGLKVEPAVDPATGKPACWIPRAQSSVLERAGFVVLDGASLIARHLERAIRRRPHDWVNLQQVQNALDQLEGTHPALVRNVVPKPISLPLLTEVLRNLVKDGVSIGPLRELLEALSLCEPGQSDPDLLAERARSALARHITHRYARSGVVTVHPLDPDIEEALRDALQKGPGGTYLALAPDLARSIIAAVSELCCEPDAGDRPLVLTHADLRRHLKRLLASDVPEVEVLSYTDLTPDITLKSLSPVRVNT